jgi:O-antigen biosynthesis protein
MPSAVTLSKGACASFFMPALSIVIPVHNQWHLTRACIDSLLRFPPSISIEIIVVDDGSTDETAVMLSELSQHDSRIRMVANGAPHRFACACNCGARAACGELLLFMNNDIEALGPGWLEPLQAVLQHRPEVGIVAPRLLFPNGTVQHCGKIWQWGDDGFPRTEHYLYEQPGDTPGAKRGGEFLTITGACLLMRREQFFQYGPFDERYENGWEDDDLCLAFKIAGLASSVCPESTLVHHQGGTLKAEAVVLERYLGVLRTKGISLAGDDPFIQGMMKQTQCQAERFAKCWQRNRELFVAKWGHRLRLLINSQEDCQAVTVVLVTYNSSGTIGACLDSLAATMRPSDRVVVVDNGSRDDTVVLVQGYLPMLPLQLLQNKDNAGYTAAGNQGIRAADTPFVVLLNPDTVVTQGWLNRLLAAFSDKQVAAVGPVSNFAAGRQSVACHWQGELPQSIAPEQAAKELYRMRQGQTEEAELLIGFCLVLRCSALEQAGLMDERLFLGNDDLELSWRLRLHGYRLQIATDCFVYHEGQHSFKSDLSTVTGQLVQQSSNALYAILETSYGPGRVPPPGVIWGIDWFLAEKAAWNADVRFDQTLFLPRSWECPSAGDKPLVTIILLTWNQWCYTEECLTSIRRHTPEPYELIVVDNGSTDGTVEKLKALATEDKRCRLVLNADNRGYAAGCNQGIHAALGEYLVLLNNDTVVTPEWLSGLLECHSSHPFAGIVGPLTNSASGIQVVPGVDIQVEDGLDLFSRSFRTANRFRRVPSRRIVGFCMLFRRLLVDQIGLLDEQFGSGNYEDDDFCLRSAVAGYQNLVAGDVYIHHYGSVSFAGNRIDYRSALARNAALFQEKWSRPVTDPVWGVRITACRLRNDVEELLYDEQVEKAFLLVQEGVEEYSGDQLMRELLRTVQSVVTGGRSGFLMRAERARQQGNPDFADALILAGFRLEPWRSDLQVALLELGLRGVDNLSSRVAEAFRLYPASRGLARLRCRLAALENSPEAVVWAEAFLADFGPDDQVIEAALAIRHRDGLYRREALPGQVVSLCMIVKDEELNLARCLASCKPVVHELVVVDTGSTDRTRLIAELFGARLVDVTWHNDFSAARNCSLDAATGDWVMVMDADETLSVRDYELFKGILSDPSRPIMAYSMTTRNYTRSSALEGLIPCRGEYPENESGSGWTPSDKVRLFPNHCAIRFSGSIHEMVESSVQAAGLAIGSHPAQIHHYGGLDDQRLAKKRSSYLEIGLKKLEQNPDDLKALYELAVQAAELERYETAEQLWLTLLVAQPAFAKGWFNLGYVLLRQGKLLESRQATDQSLRIEPGYTDALVNRGLCEACLFSGDEAFQSASHLLDRCPDNPTVMGLAGLALYRVGRSDDGRQLFQMLKVKGQDCKGFLKQVLETMQRCGNNVDLAAVRQALADASGSGCSATESTNSCS